MVSSAMRDLDDGLSYLRQTFILKSPSPGIGETDIRHIEILLLMQYYDRFMGCTL